MKVTFFPSIINKINSSRFLVDNCSGSGGMPTRTHSTTDPACWECWRSRCPPLAWNYPPLSRADLSPVTQAGGMGLKEGTTPTDKSIGGVGVFSFLTSQGGTTLEGHLSSRVHCLLCRHRSSLSPSAQYYRLVPPWNRS